MATKTSRQRMNAYHITMVESDEGVAVWCDDLPGCCSQGETRTAAVANIKEAIREYMAARRELEVAGGAKVLHEMVAV